MADRKELKKLFAEESSELLDRVEEICIECKKDDVSDDNITEIYRTVHSLKGSARMFGFEEIEKIYHDLEDVLDFLRQHPSEWSSELRALILECIDWTRIVIGVSDESEQSRDEIQEELSEKLKVVRRDLLNESGIETTSQSENTSKYSKRYKIILRLSEEAAKEGIEPLFLLEELDELGDAEFTFEAEALPEIDALDPELIYGYWVVHLNTDASLEVVKDVFLFVDDTSGIQITSFGQLEEQESEGAESNDSSPNAPTQKNGKGSTEAYKYIKVETGKLDRLLNIVGELVINQSQLQNGIDNRSGLENQHAVEEQDRLLGQLRNVVMDMRMVPMESLFLKIKRAVHDLSDSTGKPLELILDGGDTEIDKKVIDQLAEPVMHLIRNAADHGIEPVEVREKQGKSKEGTLSISAAHDNGEFTLSVSDDGSGLDVKKIKQKAIEKGILSKRANPSDRELIQLIFEPALSTADSISSISGRGMGMDVVKRRIESLNGNIRVHSEPGKGTTFNLRLPMTLSIMECLLVDVAGSQYSIPVRYIDHCQQLSKELIQSERDLINIDDQPITLIRLYDLLSKGATPSDDSQLVVIRHNEQQYGIMVDGIVGTIQAVLKPLHKLFDSVDMVSAATILGDGQVGYILDIPSILVEAEAQEYQRINNDMHL